jgi:hypothetical protein
VASAEQLYSDAALATRDARLFAGERRHENWAHRLPPRVRGRDGQVALLLCRAIARECPEAGAGARCSSLEPKGSSPRSWRCGACALSSGFSGWRELRRARSESVALAFLRSALRALFACSLLLCLCAEKRLQCCGNLYQHQYSHSCADAADVGTSRYHSKVYILRRLSQSSFQARASFLCRQ